MPAAMKASRLQPDQRERILSYEKMMENNFHKSARGLVSYLLSAGVAYQRELLPSDVAIYPPNKGGAGCYPKDARDILGEVFDEGYDEREVNPICTDVPDDKHDAWYAKNKLIRESSSGILTAMQNSSIQFVSLACTHFNQGLMMGQLAHDHPHQDMCIDGKISIEKVAMKSPELANKMRTGLVWTVIPSWLLDEFKWMSGLICDGHNSGGAIQRVTTDLQSLMTISEADTDPKDPGSFNRVKMACSRNRPRSAESVPEMIGFHRKFAGKTMLPKVEPYIRSNLVTKVVPCDKWTAVSADVNGQDQILYWRWVVVMCVITEKAQLSTSDIRKAEHKDYKAKVVAANGHLKKVFDYMDGACKSHPDAHNYLGAAAVDIVFSVLGKSNPRLATMKANCGEDPSVENIAAKLFADVRSVFKCTHLTTIYDGKLLKEKDTKKKDKPDKDKTKQQPTERQYNDKGLLQDAAKTICSEKGFAIGDIVVKKKAENKDDKEGKKDSLVIYKINNFDKDNVILRKRKDDGSTCGEDVRVNFLEFQSDVWRKHKVKEVAKLDDWHAKFGPQHSFQIEAPYTCH